MNARADHFWCYCRAVEAGCRACFADMHWDVEADKASFTWDYEDCACGIADDAYTADVRCEYSVSEFFWKDWVEALTEIADR